MKKSIFYLITVAVLSLSGSAVAQGTAFTYQGQLNSGGSPANGIYDLRFAVFDAAGGGAQQGNAVTNSAVSVSNGLFTVILDFGNQFPGANRWLDIGVRTNGGGAFTPLTSRQQITSTPYAITSANAAQASSVAAANITGTLPDARLSSNVALRAGGNNFTNNQAIIAGSLFFDNSALILGKNSGGVYENVFYPRWSDNITYLNYGSGGFHIRNNGNASTMFMQNDGKVGLGTTSAGFPLNFASVVGEKISLYGNSGNHYGFGIQGNLLQIFTDHPSSDVAFGWGQSTNLTEAMRVRGNGNVGIGTTTPGRLLQVGGLNKEGLMRFLSASTNGPTRTWDVGVPLNDLSTSGKFYSFIIDDTGTTLPELLIRWDNGFVGIGKTNPATRLDVAGEITSTAMNLTSDRNEKEAFTPVDPRAVLDKVVQLPITEWRYKSQTDARHMGPVAQDFREAFGLGRDDKHITTVDADGVALAAIKGLNEKLEQQTREKDRRIAELEKEMGQLKEMLSRLAAGKATDAK